MPAAVSLRSAATIGASRGSSSSSPIHASNRSPKMYSSRAARAGPSMNATNRRVVSASPAVKCRSEMKSAVTEALLEELDALDDDRLDGDVGSEWPAAARRPVADVVDDFHSFDDFAEHGVAPARRPRVQVDVVGEIDVELARAGMRIVGAREADRAAQIAQAVARFVDDVLRDGLRLQVWCIAAGLGDEPCDDAMEDDAGVEAFFDVLLDRVDGARSAVAVELDDEVTRGRDDADARQPSRRRRRGSRILGGQQVGREEQAEQQRSDAHGRRPRMHCLRTTDDSDSAFRPWLLQRKRSSAALTVFAISIAIVSGPTPPGTGVRAPAVAATSGCTSPTSTEPRFSNTCRRSLWRPKIRLASSADVTELMPTSMTTAPGLTKSGVTNAGRPIAATRMSAVRAIAGRSRVRG